VEQTSDDGKVEVVECDSDRWKFVDSDKYGAEWARVGWKYSEIRGV